jgi:siroheme synthase
LIAGGRDPATPAAIVENASLPAQRVVTSRLDEIAASAREHAVVPPAAVIVGEVVRRSR